MKHYGDITKLNGAELPAVDVITGGSPCQDLSVAGKRAGLAGERSGLFMEQIRVIKEMRQHDRDCGRTGKLVRPRYMVWENVPGAFSSNSGEDFRAVLEETAHIADKNAVVPQPPNGKWTTSGAIMGDEWSIAWRVLDAQFWGVPQRRRRIALVADFGGESAPEILFERESVSGHFAESGETGEGIARDAESGFGETGVGYWQPGIQCLRAEGENRPSRPSNVICATGIDRSAIAPVTFPGVGITSKENASKGTPELCHTLNQDSRNYVVAGFSYKASPGAGSVGYAKEQAPTILGERQDASVFDARGNGDGAITTYSFQRTDELKESHIASTQSARQYKSATDLVGNNQSVRRLTPLECERLQGYTDGWTDIGDWIDSKGKVHKPSDSARYKALGNSIALPPWRWVLLRITAQYERPATLGSLFDGIGGFPLIWERLNGVGTCLWASEIEEFCIAVTRLRFERTVRA